MTEKSKYVVKEPSASIDFLQARIKERGLSQREVARAMGYPAQTLTDLFKGKRRLSFLDVALLEACGLVDAEEVLSREIHQARTKAKELVLEGGIAQAQEELLQEQRAFELRRELSSMSRLRHIPLEKLEELMASLPPKDPEKVARGKQIGKRIRPTQEARHD